MVPFLWMGFSCLKDTDPLRENSLLFTVKSSGIPGILLVNLGRMKCWFKLAATLQFRIRLPLIGNPESRSSLVSAYGKIFPDDMN